MGFGSSKGLSCGAGWGWMIGSRNQLMLRHRLLFIACLAGWVSLGAVKGWAQLGQDFGQPAGVARQGMSPEELARLTAGAHYSLTRQFVIYGATRTGWLPGSATATNLVRLEPNLLSISCERIKRATLKEFGVSQDRWRGDVRVQLHPARSVDEGIQIMSMEYPDSWSYRLDLPDAVDRDRLVEAVVDVLLLEMANRGSEGRCAEIPAWLAKGVTQQLLSDRETDLVLREPDKMEAGVNVARLVRSEARTNSLAKAHDWMSRRPPLTLDELSWPTDEQLKAGEEGLDFRCSAQLLFCELARLPDGKACLRDFLAALPRRLNWQLALLDGFHGHFGTQREFEKWWALTVESFMGRDLSQTWSVAESWQKVDEIIRPAVQVRTSASELPLRTAVTLQTILREWDYAKQTAMIRTVQQQLMLVRLHVAQPLAPAVDAYRKVLEEHLKKVEKVGFVPLSKGISMPRFNAIVRETTRQLDGLDTQFQALRPPVEPGEQPAGTVGGIAATR